MKKEQQPAFPQPEKYLLYPEYILNKYPELYYERKVYGEGLTIRQWYAGKAMQGMLSSSRFENGNAMIVAESAFKYADAMIKYEEKEGKE